MRFTRPAALTALLLSPLPATAQDDGGSMIQRFIQSKLSSSGREVRITGFEGLLSGAARLGELTIADDEGVWLTLRDAQLDWSRAALLRGNLMVETLSAGELIVERLPAAAPGEGEIETPKAEASGFSLPELPVSIRIDRLAIDRAELGAPVLGQAAVLGLEGAVQLAGGEGTVDLDTRRLDGPEDRISLHGAFTNESRVLSLGLEVTEEEGGLVTTLMKLPGAPSIDLSIQGEGPLDDFTADIGLRTDGQDRITGTVGVRSAGDGNTGFAANIGGDVTPMLPAEFHEFFGTDIRLVANGSRNADGTLDLPQFSLQAQSLALEGSLNLGANSLPTAFNVTGRMGTADGSALRLPVSGAGTYVGNVTLDAQFDAAVGEQWTLKAKVADLQTDAAGLDALSLDGTGRISTAGVAKVTADLLFDVSGLAMADLALAEALGAALSGGTSLNWEQGGALNITRLDFDGADFRANLLGDARIAGRSLKLSGEGRAHADDLQRFSALAGRPLTGNISADVTGQGDVLGGQFAVTADVAADGISIGQETADRLLDGPLTLSTAARRDTEGTVLDFFRLRSAGVTADASGRVGSGASDLGFSATLTDVGLVMPGHEGALNVSGNGRETAPGDWTVGLDVDGPYALAGKVSGRVHPGESDLTLDISLPDIAPLVPGHEGPVSIRGQAAEAGNGRWNLDLDVGGPYDLTATVNGLYAAGESDFTLDVALPDIAPLVPGHTGAVKVDGRAAEAGSRRWDLDLGVAGPYDLTATVNGLYAAGESDFTLDVALPDIAPLVPGHTGAVKVDGRAAEAGAGRWDLDLDVGGPYALTATVRGLYAARESDFTLDLALPDVAPLVPGHTGALNLAGTAAETGNGGWRFSLDGSGPYAADLDLDGTVGGGPGTVTFTAGLPDVSALVPSLTGPLDVKGSANEEGDGRWRVDLDASGPLDATASVAGLAGGGKSDLNLDVIVPDLSPLVPQLAGAATLRGNAAEIGDGRWRVDFDATGPSQSSATIDGAVGATGSDVALVLAVPDISPFVPGQRGSVNASANAAQTETGAWDLSLDASGPYSSTLAASGTYGAGASRLAFKAALPDIGVLVPAYSGPITLDGTASEIDAGAWDIKLDAGLPYNGTANVAGRIASGATAVDLSVNLPSIAPFAPGLTGGVSASGNVAQDGTGYAVNFDTNGPQGASSSIRGTVSGDFSTLALTANGTAPLGLANGVLAPRAINGTASFNLAINGAPSLNAISGTVTVNGADLALPTLRQTLNEINVQLGINAGTLQIETSADGPAGGSLGARGTLQLASLNADLDVSLNQFVLTDPMLFQTTLGGGVNVSGPLTGGANISGRINVGRTEIRVPDGGLGFGGTIPDVTHTHEPANVFLTRERAGLVNVEKDSRVQSGPSRPFGLDVTVSAPEQIFIRGRGLDTELGGRLLLRGTTANPNPVGQIEVIRGRLDILGQRLTVTEGTISMAGGLVPYLDLTASASREDFEFQARITGPVDDPSFELSSIPDLPQDEVLAHFLFGKSVTDLSALQAVQMASALATLTGRGGVGLLGNLRQGLGLDDLDLTSTDDGGTEVRAGRYLTDNVYTEFVADSDGETEVEINIDVSRTVTIRGSARSDGDSGIGIFFERDY